MALGDSLAEGRGAPGPDGGWFGWAPRLADMFGLGEVVNLGMRGATVRDVVERQLPRLHGERPLLVSLSVGFNDAFGDFDEDAYARDLDRVVCAAAAASATVLTFGLPDASRWLPLPEGRRRKLSAGIAAVNFHMLRVSAAYGARSVPAHRFPDPDDPVMWSSDGLHLSAAGHQRLAESAASVLRTPERPSGPLVHGVAVSTGS